MYLSDFNMMLDSKLKDCFSEIELDKNVINDIFLNELKMHEIQNETQNVTQNETKSNNKRSERKVTIQRNRIEKNKK